MDVVTQQELLKDLDAYLDRVAGGESFIIVRGKTAIGVLGPVHSNSAQDQLRGAFRTPVDPGWAQDLRDQRSGSDMEDPWERG